MYNCNSDGAHFNNEGVFNWKEQADGGSIESPILSGINLKVASKQLVAVVGSVGSGKSSSVTHR